MVRKLIFAAFLLTFGAWLLIHPARTAGLNGWRDCMTVHRHAVHPEASLACTMNAPSLPTDVVARAFVAKNGELGIAPKDAEAFLQACEQDGVVVLGWEAWIVNHCWDFDLRRPLPASGSWCGLFPTLSHGAMIGAADGGIGNADATRRDIAAFALDPEWSEFIRFNFTLE